MGLSCSCDFDFDPEPGFWLYDYSMSKLDFEHLDMSRAKRCCSCKALIKVGDICMKYKRYRYPYSDIESRIKCGCDLDDSFCDEPQILMANHYHCERCGEIWLNLIAVGYECLCPRENMEDNLKEYHELTGFKIGEKCE